MSVRATDRETGVRFCVHVEEGGIDPWPVHCLACGKVVVRNGHVMKQRRRRVSTLCKLCRRRCYFVPTHCREPMAIRCEQCLAVFCRRCARKHFVAEDEVIVREITRSLSPKERRALKLVSKQVKKIERQWRMQLRRTYGAE